MAKCIAVPPIVGCPGRGSGLPGICPVCSSPCVARPPVPNCPGPGPAPDAHRCPSCQNKEWLIERRRSLGERANVFHQDGEALLERWTGNVDRLLERLHQAYLASQAHPPPCDYAFVVCGSGSRKEACPYSDLDCVMLVATDGHAELAYFREMAQYIDEELQRMQEEDFKDPATGQPVRGLRFCGGGLNPLGRRGALKPRPGGIRFAGVALPSDMVELIRTPQAMAEIQESAEEKHVSEGLLETRFVFGSPGKAGPDLHTAYRQELEAVLGQRSPKFSWRPLLMKRKRMALKFMGEVVSKFQPPKPDAHFWNIKEQFYRAPQFVVKSLAYWYGITDVATFDQLAALESSSPRRISAVNAGMIRRLFNTVGKTRALAHLEAGTESDIVWTFGNHQHRANAVEKLLTQQETQDLRYLIRDLETLQTLTRQFLAEKQKAVGTRRNPFA